MKRALYLVIMIAALAYAEEVVEYTLKTKEVSKADADKQSTFINTPPAVADGVTADIHQAVAGDLDLKMVSMEDGTPRGKCYCSCNLNSQPVFLEVDPNNLSANYVTMQ